MCSSLVGATIESVEERLHNLFPDAFPVLCSSARAAIALCIVERELHRNDLVDIFPYASHCVIDAVARRATPQPFGSGGGKLRIVYHQWGFVQERSLDKNSIEDAVDTLCAPGCSLFPANGSVEIWSFPKILGTLGGGVIWCHTSFEAQKLRRLRDESGASMTQWFLRIFGQFSSMTLLHWQGAETLFPRPSKLQLGELQVALSSWNQLVLDRAQKLKIVEALLPPWLSVTQGRFPPTIPLELNEQGITRVRERGFCIGMRHMEAIDASGNRRLVEVFPLPIHQGVTKENLQSIVSQILPYLQEQ